MGEFITIGLFLTSLSFIEENPPLLLVDTLAYSAKLCGGMASAYVSFAAQQAHSLFSVTNKNVMLPTLLNTSMCASVTHHE